MLRDTRGGSLSFFFGDLICNFLIHKLSQFRR